jgi:peptidoglycan hydrolase-like protein with peptidoglycan-binding domain
MKQHVIECLYMRLRSVFLLGLCVGILGVGFSTARADATVEAMVRATFADAPVMIRVADCESKFRQFTDSGNVLHGGTGGKMIGVYQLYGDIHRSAADKLGFNIDTMLGNISYARYLYDQEGTDPWMSSFSCWNDKTVEGTTSTQPIAVTTPAVSTPQTTAGSMSGVISTALSFGMIDPQVLVLQQLLNAAGFVISSDGPGSPGQETTKFGLLTRDAVKRFQCARGITCSGDEYSSGYGYVGVRTRSELMSLAQNPSSSNTSSNTAAVVTASAPAPKIDHSAEISALKIQIADLQKKLMELEAAQ